MARLIGQPSRLVGVRIEGGGERRNRTRIRRPESVQEAVHAV
jgi:hypothetical protein